MPWVLLHDITDLCLRLQGNSAVVVPGSCYLSNVFKNPLNVATCILTVLSHCIEAIRQLQVPPHLLHVDLEHAVQVHRRANTAVGQVIDLVTQLVLLQERYRVRIVLIGWFWNIRKGGLMIPPQPITYPQALQVPRLLNRE